MPIKPLSWNPHKTSNLTRKVMYFRDVIRYTEEMQEKKLKNQNVVKMERIKNKINIVLTPTLSLIISF